MKDPAVVHGNSLPDDLDNLARCINTNHQLYEAQALHIKDLEARIVKLEQPKGFKLIQVPRSYFGWGKPT